MGQGSPLQIGVVARIRNIGDVPVEPKTSQEFLQLGTCPQRPSFGIDTADSSLFLSPVFSCRNVTLHCIADATSKASLAVHVDMAGSARIHLRRTYMKVPRELHADSTDVLMNGLVGLAYSSCVPC